MKLETLAIHGANKHTELGEHIYPLYQTSTYVFKNVKQGANRFAGKDKGYKYTRLGNPTVDLLAKKIALLEAGDCGKIYPSGMAAISTVLLGLLKEDDHVLADSVLYACTDSLLRDLIERYDVDVKFVDFSDLQAVKKNLDQQTKVLFFESMPNPTLEARNISALAKIAHQYNKNIKVVVDNTFPTPVYTKPLKLGADVVVHSCTKYINGHGDVVAGAAVFKKSLLKKMNRAQFDIGTNCSPFDAWLMLRGIKTLPLRMREHTANAKKVANFLIKQKKIKNVRYPGYSGMITFEIRKGLKAGEKLLNKLKLCSLAVSLGNIDTLICHPASMTHAIIPKAEREKAGIADGLIRLSVGIENYQDIIDDLKQALNKI